MAKFANIIGGSGKQQKKISIGRTNVILFLIKEWMGAEETSYE